MRPFRLEALPIARHPVVLAAALMTFAVTCVAIDTMIVRVVSREVHPFEIAFFRNLFSIVVIAPSLLATGRAGLRTERMGLHVLRALLKLAALICFFYAAATSPLAMVTAILFASPLFVVLGSMLFLHERIRAARGIALVAGFVGMLIVIRPGSGTLDLGITLAVFSAIGLAAVMLLMKYVSVRERSSTIVALNVLITIPAAFVLALPVWTFPSPPMLALLAVQGILGGLAQLSVSRAMSMADASILAPIEFVRLPLVVVLAWVLFREPSDVWTLVGGTIIFGSTLAVVVFERHARTSTARRKRAGTWPGPGGGGNLS